MLNFDRFISWFVNKQESRKERLNKIIALAEAIARQNPNALPDLVRLLGRNLQSNFMSLAVTCLNEHKIPNLEPKLVWFDEFHPLNAEGIRLFDLKQRVAQRTLNLASDLILPWPWNLERVASSLSCIGNDRRSRPWKQDEINHFVEYWLPFGIGWVKGGNHSIMTGIIQGQGAIITDDAFDLTMLFPLVRFDGDAFIRISDGSCIQKVKNFEFAAIFEVGRIMNSYGITA